MLVYEIGHPTVVCVAAVAMHLEAGRSAEWNIRSRAEAAEGGSTSDVPSASVPFCVTEDLTICPVQRDRGHSRA